MKWQPIATVPKNGELVTGGWFAWDDGRPPIEHIEYHLAWDRKANGLRRTGHKSSTIFTPTHWRREK